MSGSLDVAPALAVSAPSDVERARIAVDGSSTRAETVRFLVRQGITLGIAKPLEPNKLRSLTNAGFVRQFGIDGVAFPESLPFATRVLIFSQGVTPNEELLRLLADFADAGIGTVVIGNEDELIAKVRSSTALASRISTVDDLSALAGRVGTIYALEDLSRGRFGHYGAGPGAQRLLPGA